MRRFALLLSLLFLAVPAWAATAKPQKPKVRISLDIPGRTEAQYQANRNDLEYQFGNVWDRLDEFGRTFLVDPTCPSGFFCPGPLSNYNSATENYPNQAGSASGFGRRPRYEKGDTFLLEAEREVVAFDRTGTPWGLSIEFNLGDSPFWIGAAWHQSGKTTIRTREFEQHLEVGETYRMDYISAQGVPRWTQSLGRLRTEREVDRTFRTHFWSATAGYDVLYRTDRWSLSPLVGFQRAVLVDTEHEVTDKTYYRGLYSDSPSRFWNRGNQGRTDYGDYPEYHYKNQTFAGATATWYPSMREKGHLGFTLRAIRMITGRDTPVEYETFTGKPLTAPVRTRAWQVTGSTAITF